MIIRLSYLISLGLFDIVKGFEFEWSYSTSLLKNDKLYVFDYNCDPFSKSIVTTYSLHDGSLEKITSNGTVFQVFQVPPIDPSYTPKFINAPNTDDLWMLGGKNYSQLTNIKFFKEQWTNTGLFEFPKFNNFPLNSYTSTIVNNTQLYIIGGFIYPEKFNQPVLSNQIFKYDLSRKKWDDLSYLTKGQLPPIAGHKAVMIDDRNLLIMGGLSPAFDDFEPSSNNTKLNSLEKIWQLDTSTLQFKPIHTKFTVNSRENIACERLGFSTNSKDKKVYIFGGIYYKDGEYKSEDQVGVLDYDTSTWDWKKFDNPSNIQFNHKIINHDSIIIGDQLLIIHGKSVDDKWGSLLNLNLKTMKLERELNYSGKLQTDKGFQLPTWALILIILIAVIIVLSIILFFVIRYRKKKSKKSQIICQQANLPSPQNTMLAIWSSPQELTSRTQITSNIFEFYDTRRTNLSNSSSIIAWDVIQQQTHIYVNSQKTHNSGDTGEDTLADTIQSYDGGKSVTYI
ncbi:hypothetical protein CONCODRAFT_71043 [Conidiobolus coronatus NRRL 28638]|uniref:Galactose oxidase n=1 Tax=Conidiobolus coronatus (strain ATCC 28846 / CBS 209.66 / NRRL 28638) TaxID=796925 RepID=A0A137P4P3_CONC2|nr:hypothetical protein CONCODRAFT_71043 [Conidiobolus coronatus NRRL 28638]|eukprot:KXN69987.1 hypothetical protein CONCODRAFT_71043 [Conidiobolus coronatus NRRL 28638]